MKKGLFLLAGIAMLLAMALTPGTSFAATATPHSQSHRGPHIFASNGHGKQNKGGVSHAATTNAVDTTYSNMNYDTTDKGPVMGGTTQVYVIFWEPANDGTNYTSYNSLITRYFNDVGSSSLYQIASQYKDSLGNFPQGSHLAATWTDTASYTATPLFDTNIQNEVTHAQQVNSWSSNIDNIFFVFTGKNESVCLSNDSCTPDVNSIGGISNSFPFCAYHNFFPVPGTPVPGNNANTIYATMPYTASPNFGGGCTPQAPFATAPAGSSPNNNDADLTINVTSHEQMEAATDPLLNAWFDANGFEIGDKCAWKFGPNNSNGADVVWNGNGYIVQQEWSNAFNSCSLTNSLTTSYYEIQNFNSGLVMDVNGGGTTLGVNMIQWPSHNGANQQWMLVPDGPFYQIINRNSGLVADVYGGGVTQGVNVIQWSNHNGPNQQWYLVPDGPNDQIVNVNSGLVMDVFGGGKTQGVNVIQWPSHNGPNQQWSFQPVTTTYYEIQNVNSGLAADVFGGGTTMGVNVIQWPYHGGTNQQWLLVPDGTASDGNPIYQIENFRSGLVLDVNGGGKTQGVNVIQWQNNNTPNQQWERIPDGTASDGSPIYQFKNVNSGLVMDVNGGGKTQGVNVIQWPNNNTPNQQWTLIPVH